MMISPMIHRMIERDDLARLIAEIARIHPAQAKPAAQAIEAGQVDAVLDSPAALDAVRGQGGSPAPLPLTLLWYIPIRATLLVWGEDDIELADYAATLPVAFHSTRAIRRVARGEMALTAWTRAIEAVPGDTIARAEQAAYCAARQGGDRHVASIRGFCSSGPGPGLPQSQQCSARFGPVVRPRVRTDLRGTRRTGRGAGRLSGA